MYTTLTNYIAIRNNRPWLSDVSVPTIFVFIWKVRPGVIHFLFQVIGLNVTKRLLNVHNKLIVKVQFFFMY